MAEPKSTFEEHPLVKKLVPDPNVLPDVVVMTGYIGRSLRDGFIRLYLSPQLDSYREIPTAGIVHQHELDHEYAPFGGSALWVKAGAQVSYVASDNEKAAAFLAGDIAARNMGQEDGGLLAKPGGTCTGRNWGPTIDRFMYTQTCGGGAGCRVR